jgi:hypothetical protein
LGVRFLDFVLPLSAVLIFRLADRATSIEQRPVDGFASAGTPMLERLLRFRRGAHDVVLRLLYLGCRRSSAAGE